MKATNAIMYGLMLLSATMNVSQSFAVSPPKHNVNRNSRNLLCDGHEIQLFYRLNGGNLQSFEVLSGSNVAGLRPKIKTMIPALGHFKLSFSGGELADNTERISDTGLCAEAVVNVDAVDTVCAVNEWMQHPSNKPPNSLLYQ